MPYSRTVKDKIRQAGGCNDFLRCSTAPFMNKSENFMAACYYCGPQVLWYTNGMLEVDEVKWQEDAGKLLRGMRKNFERNREQHAWIRVVKLSGEDVAIFPLEVRKYAAFKFLSLLLGVPTKMLHLVLQGCACVSGSSLGLSPLLEELEAPCGDAVQATVIISQQVVKDARVQEMSPGRERKTFKKKMPLQNERASIQVL
jgi:hypothetical protein